MEVSSASLSIAYFFSQGLSASATLFVYRDRTVVVLKA